MPVAPVVPNPLDPRRAVLHALIRGRLRGRYLAFDVDDEIDCFPAGPLAGRHSLIGYVVADDGRVFAFRLAWDATARAPVLAGWEEIPRGEPWTVAIHLRADRARARREARATSPAT